MTPVAVGCLSVVGALLAVPPVRQDFAGPFTVVAGQQFGIVRETTSRTGLAADAPGVPIEDAAVHLGEGFCTDGTVLYGGSPDQVEIAWQNPDRSRVAFVRTSRAGGRWVTLKGVRVGSTLRELERVAGHVLTFSGFNWDYGGSLDWREPPGAVRLSVSPDPPQGDADPEISGDRLVRSDHPAIRRLRIVVRSMTVIWGTPVSQHDCTRHREEPR